MQRLSTLLILTAMVLTRASWSADTETLDLGNGVTLELIQVRAGSFKMGSPESETGRGPDEEQFDTIVKDDFFIGKFPVTRGQFSCFVKESGYRTESEIGTSGGSGWDGTAMKQRKDFNWRHPGFDQADDHPVVLITYADAQAFCRWLERKSNRTIALPTEAQWEYACRAGTTTRYYAGDDSANADAIAWFKDNAGNGTHPVGKKAANAWGLYDMCGNVFEWCQDTYGPYRPGGPVQGTQDKPRNVLRGGSWLKSADGVRSAARYRNTPGSRNADNGFRIVAGPRAAAAIEAPPPTNPATRDVEAPLNAPTPPQDTSADFEQQRAMQEQQRAMQERARSMQERNETSAFPFVLLLLGVPFAFIVAWIIYAILKASGPVAQRTPQSLVHVRPRLVDDGFWFDTHGYNAGDIVTYTYEGPGGMLAKEFRVEPSTRGQFIYTGHRPGNLQLDSLLPALAMMQQRPPPPSRSTYVATPSRRETSSGFPSAY